MTSIERRFGWCLMGEPVELRAMFCSECDDYLRECGACREPSVAEVIKWLWVKAAERWPGDPVRQSLWIDKQIGPMYAQREVSDA